MTRTVAEKAMQLLTKSVSDIAGEERRIAEALVMELRATQQIFAAPIPVGFTELDPAMRKQVHGHAVAIAQSLTVH